MPKPQRTVTSAVERAESQQTGSGFTYLVPPDGINFFNVEKEGTYYLNVIPFLTGDGNPYKPEGVYHFERTFYTHRGIGADENTYLCPAKMWGEKCPICEARKRMMQDPHADEDAVKALAVKERQAFYVFDTKDPDKGIQLFDISYHLFGKQLNKAVKVADEDEGADTFHSPDSGSVLKVYFEEKHFGRSTYYEASVINFKPRREEMDMVTWDEVDELVSLDDPSLWQRLSYDELRKIFYQEPEGATTETEDDEAPAPPRKSTAKKKTGGTKKKPPAPEPEVDDDWEEEEEEEAEEEVEEEEETPPPPRKGTKKKGTKKGAKTTNPKKAKSTKKKAPAPEPEPEPEEESSAEAEDEDDWEWDD